MNKNLGRKFLSDLKLYSDFLGWKEEEGRYETYEEAIDDIINSTHKVKYEQYWDKLTPYIDFASNMAKQRRVLPAMRHLQFRGKDIFKHELRGYNCCVLYADKPEWIGNAFYLSLCGCGVGVNMMLPFTDRMPAISPRKKGTKTFTIPDSIEGWVDAAHIIFSSYIDDAYDVVPGYQEWQGYEIKFDFSLIRAKGSKVGRKFLAPGPNSLRKSLDKIEALLNNAVGKGYTSVKFTTILQYDCFMHLMDAVLSGGVRRSAASIMFSREDLDLLNCKSGNWRQTNKQRERSNNSVGLIKGTFTQEEFKSILALNKGGNDVGFVLMNNIFEIYNPCFEIGFTPLYIGVQKDSYTYPKIIDKIQNNDITVLDTPFVRTCVQCCNLTEGNMALCKNKTDFLDMCKAQAIFGTLQAGYTNFKHLKGCLRETIEVTQEESLLGVSMAGIMNQPWILEHPEVLREGVELIKKTNEEIASIININPAARLTCIKPGGDGPTVLMCEPSTMGAHSKRGFRIMQLNKDTETAKYLQEHMNFLLEESDHSENHTDYVVFTPYENDDTTKYKSEIRGKKHLEIIKYLMDNWVKPGRVEERCIIPTTCHNVSNTIIVDEPDYNDITDYIYHNQDSFAAVAFMDKFGDKDHNQSPFTSVLTSQEILEKYGEASLFASGLVVDALHAFEDNLWDACHAATDPEFKLTGDRVTVLIKKDIIRRFKKFAKNYFKNDMQSMIYCLKDVHLYHKWMTINRQMKPIDFTEILTKPSYIEIDTIGAKACAGNVCSL